jgi:tetratricopeptide (TPR) repeat protein
MQAQLDALLAWLEALQGAAVLVQVSLSDHLAEIYSSVVKNLGHHTNGLTKPQHPAPRPARHSTAVRRSFSFVSKTLYFRGFCKSKSRKMSLRNRTVSLIVILIAACSMPLQAQESAASLYNAGLEKAKAKEYAEALSLMEQAIEAAGEGDEKVVTLAKKNGSRAAYALGFQHRKAEEYDEALAMHQKGIDYNPDYYSNYRGKAQVLEAQGQNEEAVAAYVQAGDVATKAGEGEKAESYYGKAGNFVAKAAVDDKWDETMALATAFLDSGGKDADVYYYYGQAQAAKGDNSAALASVTKALEMGASDEASKYYMLKGGIHAALGQKAEAVEAYSMVTDAKYAERARYEIDQLQQ